MRFAHGTTLDLLKMAAMLLMRGEAATLKDSEICLITTFEMQNVLLSKDFRRLQIWYLGKSLTQS